MTIKYITIFLIIACFTPQYALPALINDDADEDFSCHDRYDEPDQATLNKKLWDAVLRHTRQDQRRLCIIDNLLEQGANPDAVINDTTQATALEYAFIQRDFELLSIFLNPEWINNLRPLRQQRTFLQRALEDNDIEMIMFLSTYEIQLKTDTKPSHTVFTPKEGAGIFNHLRSLLKI